MSNCGTRTVVSEGCTTEARDVIKGTGAVCNAVFCFNHGHQCGAFDELFDGVPYPFAAVSCAIIVARETCDHGNLSVSIFQHTAGQGSGGPCLCDVGTVQIRVPRLFKESRLCQFGAVSTETPRR